MDKALESDYLQTIKELRNKNKLLKDGLSSALHALYATQDLIHEHPTLKGHSLTIKIIDSALTRASDLLRESEDE